ncbi:EIF3C-like protein, partial [Mya arenaria]
MDARRRMISKNFHHVLRMSERQTLTGPPESMREHIASLDEPTQTVIMHRTEPTRLQALALQLSEKVGNLVENNERILEIKQGNFFFNKSG